MPRKGSAVRNVTGWRKDDRATWTEGRHQAAQASELKVGDHLLDRGWVDQVFYRRAEGTYLVRWVLDKPRGDARYGTAVLAPGVVVYRQPVQYGTVVRVYAEGTAWVWPDAQGGPRSLAVEAMVHADPDADPKYRGQWEDDHPRWMPCYECRPVHGVPRVCLGEGPVGGGADPTQLYRLECGHLAM